MNPKKSQGDPFADLNPLNSQIPAFAIPPTNDGCIKVEIVTSSSQVSPLEKSESINQNQWMRQTDPNNRFDQDEHIGQGVKDSNNVRNNNNNNLNFSNTNTTLLTSILSVDKSNIANNTANTTGLPLLK